jgi:hypothetical protein
VSGSTNDKEILAVHISRRDLAELIDTLKKAEELCESMRAAAQDFRMHRVRLEVLQKQSEPPPSVLAPDRRESTRYVMVEDLGDLRARKEPEGGSSR